MGVMGFVDLITKVKEKPKDVVSTVKEQVSKQAPELLSELRDLGIDPASEDVAGQLAALQADDSRSRRLAEALRPDFSSVPELRKPKVLESNEVIAERIDLIISDTLIDAMAASLLSGNPASFDEHWHPDDFASRLRKLRDSDRPEQYEEYLVLKEQYLQSKLASAEPVALTVMEMAGFIGADIIDDYSVDGAVMLGVALSAIDNAFEGIGSVGAAVGTAAMGAISGILGAVLYSLAGPVWATALGVDVLENGIDGMISGVNLWMADNEYNVRLTPIDESWSESLYTLAENMDESSVFMLESAGQWFAVSGEHAGLAAGFTGAAFADLGSVPFAINAFIIPDLERSRQKLFSETTGTGQLSLVPLGGLMRLASATDDLNEYGIDKLQEGKGQWLGWIDENLPTPEQTPGQENIGRWSSMAAQLATGLYVGGALGFTKRASFPIFTGGRIVVSEVTEDVLFGDPREQLRREAEEDWGEFGEDRGLYPRPTAAQRDSMITLGEEYREAHFNVIALDELIRLETETLTNEDGTLKPFPPWLIDKINEKPSAVADRELALEAYQRQVAELQSEGFDMEREFPGYSNPIDEPRSRLAVRTDEWLDAFGGIL